MTIALNTTATSSRGTETPHTGDLILPDDLEKLPVVAVLKDSPAWDLLLRLCKTAPLRPGQIIPASEEELESLRHDTVNMQIFPEDKSGERDLPNVELDSV